MKKTLIVAGLISAAGLLTAVPAGATPVSTVGCSPVILCTIDGQIQESRTSVTGFVTEGPKTFVNSVTDLVTNGPKTFVNSITNPGSIE
jgi:hypothetical protein